MTTQTESLYGEIIYKYTRADAIEDGVLVDITTAAKEWGFKYPVAVTSAVYAGCIEGKGPYQDKISKCNLEILLRELYRLIKFGSSGGHRIDFKFNGQELYSLCHGGDNLEPVITIMEIGED
jgi:hypothetical protein